MIPVADADDAAELFAVEITVNLGAADHDFFVQLPAEATGADLYRLLASPESGLAVNRLPPLLTIERSRQALGHDQLLVDAELMTGDRLVPVLQPDRNGSLVIEFLTGPEQGSLFSLARFEHMAFEQTVVGRQTGPGFDDPSVSRRHAGLGLTASSLTVEDLGATNGVIVNGRRLAPGDSVEVHLWDVVELGQVSCRLREMPRNQRRPLRSPFSYRLGRLGFQPSPRAVEPQPPASVELPTPPAEPPRRRFPIASALLPLFMGAVLAYLFTPVFAVFMTMSPLMVIWTFVDDRRSGRRSFEAERATFREDLERRRLDAADVHDQLAAWRRRRTPSTDQIGRWSRSGAKELWARRPRHADFLLLAVGTADRPSRLVLRPPAGVTAEAQTDGVADLAAEADAVAVEMGTERAVPLTIDLAATPVVGVSGVADADEDVVAGIARSMTAQLVGLRSPRDLRLAVLAPSRPSHWRWATWLPHVRDARVDLPAGSRLLAGDDQEAAEIFGRLLALAEERAAALGDRIGGSTNNEPHYFIVLHPPVGVAPAAVARLLALAPKVGFSVLYVVGNRQDLPSDVAVHVEVKGQAVTVHELPTGQSVAGGELWTLTSDQALELARDLAPIADVTSGDSDQGIPPSVSLPGLDEIIDEARLGARWASAPGGLAATVGVDAAGPVVLDLQVDGPHALVAGTTGAGKSEFLQTLIADLAGRHSPTELNFILVDYKGGAAFRQCQQLPHTVGFVTDLDDRLAERALVSLRAELRHRERVLGEAGVSDLAALRASSTDDADQFLPSLVIIVDEFAALKSEVPDFVDGLIDVAQRGRSMGVHMILATQKPGGVVTPQIDANTNIRVVLRVANESDSRDLIGVADAAEIPTGFPGRGVIKVGGGSELAPFQTAYVGSRSRVHSGVETGLADFGYGARRARLRPVAAAPSDDHDLGRAAASSDSDDTDLALIVAAARAAWSTEPRPPLRRPWLPPLPGVTALDRILKDGGGGDCDLGLGMPIGLADLPRRQAQEPYLLDLNGAGHVAVYGAAGSGKSTLLRTIACSLCLVFNSDRPGPVVYGIDFGGGLAMIEALPAVADLIPGADHERLLLLIDHLERELEQRQRQLVDRPPPIVVLIDGFAPFWEMLEGYDFGRAAEKFVMLMSQARSVGIHMILTADQRSAIPFSCLGAVGLRLLQRLASPDEYRSLGLNHAPSPGSMPPGRTLVVDGPEIQIAVPMGEPDGVMDPGMNPGMNARMADGRQQAVAIDALAGRLGSRWMSAGGPPIRALDDIVELAAVGETNYLSSVPIGLSPARQRVTVDLVDNPTMLVLGGAGSGRSTVLLTLGHQLRPLVVDRRAVAAKRSSPINDAAVLYAPVLGPDGPPASAALEDLAAEIEDRAKNGFDQTMLLAIDDADAFFDDGDASRALTKMVLNCRDAGVVMLVSATSFRAGAAYETWIRALRSAGHGIVLQPGGDKDEDLFDVRFPRGSAMRFPSGRGYLIVRSTVQVVQVATGWPGAANADGQSDR